MDALPGSNFINHSDADLVAVIRSLVENLNIPESEEDDDGDDSDGDKNDGDDDPSDDDSDNDSFEPSEFVQRLFDVLGRLVVRALVAQHPEEEQCIQRVANGFVNREARTELDELVQDLRRAVSTLSRIGAFLEAQEIRLSRANILPACVSRFIDLAFCSRCSKKTPPLCFNTCNALLRGCYSPYYTILNRQYSRLWEVVREVVSITNTTIQDILEEEKEIIDFESFVSYCVH